MVLPVGGGQPVTLTRALARHVTRHVTLVSEGGEGCGHGPGAGPGALGTLGPGAAWGDRGVIIMARLLLTSAKMKYG